MPWPISPKIPQELGNKVNDNVSYAVTIGESKYDYNNAACYMAVAHQLPECEFFLRPNDKKSVLPWDAFVRWVELCKENGVITPEATPSRDGDLNLLHMPKGNNRHLVYASLCCYRWSENQPGAPWLVVELLNANPKIDFFQALHYACTQVVYYFTHSFTQIICNNGKCFYNHGQYIYNLYIPYSAVLAWFYRDKVDGRTKAQTISTDTSWAIKAFIMNAKIPLPSAAGYTDYMVSKDSDLLLEELTPFYKNWDNDKVISTIKKLKK